jgi:SAM-dependent methyltransferase
MEKESKLYEKSTRMPDIREPKWEQIVHDYLESVASQNSESARSKRFLLFLNELFGVQPSFIEDYVSGVEKYIKVKQKDGILKGRVDELFGNLIIEFERDLAKKQTEAEEQLRKYVACLWSQETPRYRTPYLCIASDGIAFATYSPTLVCENRVFALQDTAQTDIQPDEVRLELIEQVDLSNIELKEVYFWLDRYFLRKEILSPKTENIVEDFGVKGHAFQVVSQTLLFLWNSLKSKSEFIVVYESWEKYLRIVYGTSVAEEELFIRHSYLATLAKLMAWMRLSEGKSSPDDVQILSVLEGQFFKDRGIENFLEEDFFSWIARKVAPPHSPPLTGGKGGVEIARQLLSLLRNYNLRELSEDVLKSLYQELVDPKTRHDLGEYYTPDWLAHRMVQNLLESAPESSILDPSCGSGTFLYLAVREKRERLNDSIETLYHILSSVVGTDIHPLAVIVAKTNYILALGDLIKKRKGKISIPIYLSDTVRLPERWAQTADADYEVFIDGKPVYLPEMLLNDPAIYDEAIDASREYAAQNSGKQAAQGEFFNFLKAHYPALAENNVIVQTLFGIAKTLKAFIEVGRDTIWAFVLKNIYKPLFLKGKFDIVVGNPPWLSYRYVEQLDYQKFLKKQITETYGLLLGRGELITHLELGTLFFVRAADLYLKEGGTIAFVLPKSIFTADQHDALRQGKFKGVGLTFREAWDLEDVTPLFNVPSCVLFAQKQPPTPFPLPLNPPYQTTPLPPFPPYQRGAGELW